MSAFTDSSEPDLVSQSSSLTTSNDCTVSEMPDLMRATSAYGAWSIASIWLTLLTSCARDRVAPVVAMISSSRMMPGRVNGTRSCGTLLSCAMTDASWSLGDTNVVYGAIPWLSLSALMSTVIRHSTLPWSSMPGSNTSMMPS